jgi:hypothetical protein
MSQKFNLQKKRIAEVFALDKPPEANMNTLREYKAFLERHLRLPIRVTGIEDFDWEEYYVLGPGDKDEYEELKKIQPSYTDIFDMLGFEEHVDDMYGLFVNVRRLSDKKKFILPLADLKGVEKKSEVSEMIDDYSVWKVNF